MTDLLRAAGLMDEELVPRAEALEALLRIERETALAAMAEALADEKSPRGPGAIK